MLSNDFNNFKNKLAIQYYIQYKKRGGERMNNYISPEFSNVISNTDFNSIASDDVVWYVVALAVLITLAVIIVSACVLFCLTKGKDFSGSYSYVNGGYDVRIGCR